MQARKYCRWGAWLIAAAFGCFLSPVWAQEAKNIHPFARTQNVLIDPIRVYARLKPEKIIYHRKRLELVFAEATQFYDVPRSNSSYYYVTFLASSGQTISGWIPEFNVLSYSSIDPVLIEAVASENYIVARAENSTNWGFYKVKPGSQFRAIGTQQNRRETWYLVQDPNSSVVWGWMSGKNIRQAGYLQQIAQQKQYEQLREQRDRQGTAALIYLLFGVYVIFAFWLVFQESYRGYCAEKLHVHRWGVLGYAPVSSICFILFVLSLFFGKLSEGGAWIAIFFALFGARAALYAPASLMDLAEYLRAAWQEQPVETAVKRILAQRGAPSLERLHEVERAMSDYADLPNVWESRNRQRRIEELKKLVERERSLLQELEQHARERARAQRREGNP